RRPLPPPARDRRPPSPSSRPAGPPWLGVRPTCRFELHGSSCIPFVWDENIIASSAHVYVNCDMPERVLLFGSAVIGDRADGRPLPVDRRGCLLAYLATDGDW